MTRLRPFLTIAMFAVVIYCAMTVRHPFELGLGIVVGVTVMAVAGVEARADRRALTESEIERRRSYVNKSIRKRPGAGE